MYKGSKCPIIKTVLKDKKNLNYFLSEVHIGRILHHYFNDGILNHLPG